MDKVLIIGDSQSQGVGSRLERILRTRGDQVRRISRPGYGTNKILEVARSQVDPIAYDRVYVFAGGNGTWAPSPAAPLKRDPESVAAMLAFFRRVPSLVWVGIPPATPITNLALGRKVFGSKVSSADYWSRTGTARRRREKSEMYRGLVEASGRDYADPSLLLDPYPPQPDGIHVVGKAAEQLAAKIAAGETGSRPPYAFIAGGFGLALGALVIWTATREWK